MATPRSTRVISELQENLETLQTELSSLRNQLNASKEAKVRHESDAQSFMQSNTECREAIQLLMQSLDNKQKQLEDTKALSRAKEEQMRMLKDQAAACRKQLERYRERELSLSKERDAALLAKEQAEQQNTMLKVAAHSVDTTLQQQLTSLERCLAVLQVHISQLEEQYTSISRSITDSLSERKTQQDQHNLIHTRIASDTNNSVRSLQAELSSLQDIMFTVDSSTETTESNVNGCHDELNSLLRRIQNLSQA